MNIILLPVTLMVSGLIVFHTFLLFSNLTTIDVMGGNKLFFNFLPLKSTKNATKVNIFNLGLFANIRNFFGKDLLFFWIPKENLEPNEGMYFPNVPGCTFLEI